MQTLSAGTSLDWIVAQPVYTPILEMSFLKNWKRKFFILFSLFQKMSKRAVVVGINYIGTSNQLSGCINDGYRVIDILTHVYGFSRSNITFMSDSQAIN